MDDLISRQAAIDAVDEGLTRAFVEHRDIAEKMINKIPSAQPEIIRCKDCKFYKDEELAKNSPKVNSDSGELISRQAAIKQILLCENHAIEHDFEFNQGLIVAMNAVEELPTAEE